MKFYYYSTDVFSPYRNLATEHSLMECARDDVIILFLWQNQDTIVVGRNQDVFSECKVDEFLRDGGQIARRMSGGGAVYHDAGNLNYSLICRAELQQYCQYHKLIKKALSYLRIDAEFNERNDLMVEGKKVSGNAVYKSGDIICQHGTILVNTDIQRMAYYLTPDISKLNRNKVQSVKSRVENICFFNSDVGLEDIKKSLIKSVEAEPLMLIPKIDAINQLAMFYKTDKWIFGGER